MTDGIFHLTGKPISFEMEVILESLANNIPVSSEDILNTYEYRIGKSLIIQGEETSELPYRDDIREKVFDEMLKIKAANIDINGEVSYNKAVVRGGRLDIVIGLPASGKSSTLVDIISNKYGSRVIDNDEAKKLIPEYHNGFGSSRVHKESQKISDKVFREVIKNKENIVLPKVGSDADKLMVTCIEPAKRAGYKVHLHYVEIDKNISQGRMIERYLGKSNRFLPINLLDKYFDKDNKCLIDVAYEKLKQEGILDGYSKWNNAVAYGEGPRFIEEYNNTAGVKAVCAGFTKDSEIFRCNVLSGGHIGREGEAMGKGTSGAGGRFYERASSGKMGQEKEQDDNKDIYGNKDRVFTKSDREAGRDKRDIKKPCSLSLSLEKYVSEAKSKQAASEDKTRDLLKKKEHIK